ncbi:NAD(P)-dependent oxidoreductase [Leucobacter ruminantium]|uniref:Hydroxyacid dehydrogenase n=1 Tax=Leucobacter ruminantium TaxID=1289170 RepID=A0A939LVW6_9MICO|nr:NAD(P)-dependent oxidoreductase [Leucobacter ruminantium]MBO1805392.1 hydroxyacid dehydrogenase [Leucobacter ruminantium]
MTRILAAGDLFIRSSHLRESLERALEDSRAEIREIEFAWPDAPFGSVAEVHEASGTEDELIEALQGSAAIATQLAPLTERVIAESPDLRMIAVSRGGPTNVNLEAARAHGVMVANVPGRNGVSTAEMTIGLALALMRRIPLSHNTLLAHEWRGEFYRYEEVGGEVAGATIGLLGAGAVGAHVARVFAAMGAEVVVFDPYLPEGVLDGVVRRVDTVEEVFRASDLVSVHARLTDETHHLVNAERLALMQPGSRLVNAARGGLVDYDAVADAIESGRLAGAAFDVFPEEPVDFGSRIFALAATGHDIVLTPHIAGASRQTASRAADGVAEEIRRFLAGEPLLHPLVELEPSARR